MSASASGTASSPSPMLKASKNGAYGSGLNAQGPPPSTSGSPSARSSACSAMPARSSVSSTFVAASSCGSVMPTTSNSATGAQLSMENSGRPSVRMVSQNAGAGRNARSAAMPSAAFTAFTSMRTAWFACPSS